MNLEKDKIKWALLRELGIQNQAGQFQDFHRSTFVIGLFVILMASALSSAGLHLWWPGVFAWWVIPLGSLLGYGLAVYLGSRKTEGSGTQHSDSSMGHEAVEASETDSELDSLFSSLENLCQQIYLGSANLLGQGGSQEAQILKVATNIVRTLLDNGKTSQSDLEARLGAQGVETSEVREAVDLLSSSDLLEVRSNGVEISHSKRAVFL